jgi:hypothetical protein
LWRSTACFSMSSLQRVSVWLLYSAFQYEFCIACFSVSSVQRVSVWVPYSAFQYEFCTPGAYCSVLWCILRLLESNHFEETTGSENKGHPNRRWDCKTVFSWFNLLWLHFPAAKRLILCGVCVCVCVCDVGKTEREREERETGRTKCCI